MKPRKSGNAAVPCISRRALRNLALGLLLCLSAAPSFAALTASLDRYTIALGETVRLSLRSDDNSNPGDANLSALQAHFEILESSSNMSTSVINGERSQVRELVLELTPRREGSIVIPPFEVDKQRSEALSVTVGPRPTVAASDEVVTFEVEVDRESVYVQGQLLLTLRVQQAVNLDSRSITELDIENAYVEPLGQNSFQRTVNGRPWLVNEIRYAIFPESSGELKIPAQAFSGRLGSGRRSLFDTRPSGRLIRRETEELTIRVNPRPSSYPSATWLPSSSLRIEEQWSEPLDSLRIGDSLTRTITLTGDGLQGAQLPPLAGDTIDGLRAYPDQPVINNVSGERGVTGIRVDSVALVAVSDGEYLLPALEVPWWDTTSDSLKVARLPERRISVAPSAQAELSLPNPTQITNAPQSAVHSAATATPLWRYLALACALGWCITGFLWWRAHSRHSNMSGREDDKEPLVPGNARRELLSACAAGNASQARAALNRWARDRTHRQRITGSLDTWLRTQASDDLATAVAELERHLYEAEGASSWDGQALASAIREQEKRTAPGKKATGSALPELYLSQ